MKILCFIDSLGSGGAQRQLVELGKGFKEKGHEVVFLTYHELNFFKPELDAVFIPVKTILEPNYLNRIFKIRRAIRREKPDAVLSFLEPSNFMATIAGFPSRKWKLVVGERSTNPNIYRSLKKVVFRWFHLFTDYVVANSEANLQIVYKINPLLKHKKGKVIYNIVNIPEKFSRKHIDNDKTNIVIAASIYPAKNLDGIIKAVNLLSEANRKQMIINWYGRITNQEYYKNCVKMIQEYHLEDYIQLHNPSTNIFEKFNESDFVGLFSHYEGFPNVISEAMALGKPIICTRVSDLPLFIKNGVNGFLCDSDEIYSIKNALSDAIESSRETRNNIRVNNINFSINIFNRDYIINEYSNLLTK